MISPLTIDVQIIWSHSFFSETKFGHDFQAWFILWSNHYLNSMHQPLLKQVISQKRYRQSG
jgi:hypothetical protein